MVVHPCYYMDMEGGISMDPGFQSNRLSLCKQGFIFAIAHIRGGRNGPTVVRRTGK